MTATDELRRLLDERGVEHEDEDYKSYTYTYWGDWAFTEPLDAKPHTLGAQCELMLIPATPAQAVEATLGRGECEINERYGDWYCTGCGDTVGTCDPDSESYVSGNFVELWDFCPYCGRKVKR